LAAIARHSSANAVKLENYHRALTELLWDNYIFPVSASADGSDTERKMQRTLQSKAHGLYLFVLAHPIPSCKFEILIPLYRGHPTIFIQDGRHAAKTYCNQFLTGARLLVFGNSPCYFEQLRELAMNPAGPLFHRDVEKVDKQDDRAAARLLSAESLSFLLHHCPEQTGLSVLLFIGGELIDAWQHRGLKHIDRAKLAFRTKLCLMAWRSHIVAHPDHSPSKHFISHECFDILMTLSDSLIALIVTYCKFYPNYPLCPWLHSTEMCEHIFGMLRQLKKDFTYLDMLHLESKLRRLMLGDFGRLAAQEQANATSSGYFHTYMDKDGIDMESLLAYPTDEELERVMDHALEECAQLLLAVGIDARAMLRQYQPPQPSRQKSSPTTSTPRPRTFLELTLLQNHAPELIRVEDEMETLDMAIAAESIDKTLEM
jgi:hypothetical protein